LADQQKAQIDAEAFKNPAAPPRWQGMPMQELKKPGESNWEISTAPSRTGYPHVSCPDGGAAAMVMSTDPNSGAAK
jgi:hypothetical protein